MRAVLMLVACVSVASGCDSKASGLSETVDRHSALYETCRATGDCGDEARCRSGVCQPAKGVRVGDYHAASGRLALSEQRYEDAIASYTAATKAYDLGKIAVPPHVDCGHGEALQRAGGDPQRFELAARILHRCLLAAPEGTELYDNALRRLAELGREGLDPELLASDKLVDRYMTGQADVPPSDNLVLTVTSKPKIRSYSFTKWLERAKTDEVKAALIPCWTEHWRASKDTTMSVTLPMRHTFKLDQYGDFSRTILHVTDLKPLGDTARDGARSCAKAAINPVADAFTKGREDERRWDAEMTFSLAPAGG